LFDPIGELKSPGLIEVAPGVFASPGAAAQGGVSTCPGAGSTQGGVSISPARAEKLMTNVKTKAALSFCSGLIFSPQIDWVGTHSFMKQEANFFQTNLNSTDKTRLRSNTQSFYQVYRKEYLT
jgi:hypothetical protein